MTVEIVEYRAAFRAELVALWGRLFAGHRHSRALDRTGWVRAIERPEFDPRHLRVAMIANRVVGFAHGGIWNGEFLRLHRPQFVGDRLGYLAMIGVAPEVRRRGIGRALVCALSECLAGPSAPLAKIEADGRMFNPFYGNSTAPRAPLWGTTEGAAVPFEDDVARGFFRELGFVEEAVAESRVAMLTGRGPTSASPSIEAGVEIVSERDYLPTLGTSSGRSFGETNHSRTWVAAEGTVQRAALIAYPFDDRAGAEWAIYSLEVDPAARGRGLGTSLLRTFLSDLRVQHRAVSVETLVIASESPAAHCLYAANGFEPVARWVVLGSA